MKVMIHNVSHKFEHNDNEEYAYLSKKESSIEQEMGNSHFSIMMHMEGEMVSFSIIASNNKHLQAGSVGKKLELSDDTSPVWFILPCIN